MSLPIIPIRVDRLGRADYDSVWEIQKTRQSELMRGEGHDSLILCEHDPVITLGRSAGEKNLLISEEDAKKQGVKVRRIERGGDITFHGPGQIVGYPIINLNSRRRDVGWYLRGLEEVVIRTLTHFKVAGVRVDGRTGVWIQTDSKNQPTRKISSCGVRISRWCTMHGFALNVSQCRDGFSLINPCGFTDITVTSLNEERELLGLSPVEQSDVEDIIVKEFGEVFSYSTT